MASEADKEGSTARSQYDLKGLEAPRLSGIQLRAYLCALENRFLGPLISRALLSKSGFLSFVSRISSDEPRTKIPLRFPQSGSGKAPTLSEIDALFQSLVKEDAPDTISLPNARRPSVIDYARAYRELSVTPLSVAKVALEAIAKSNSKFGLQAVTRTNRVQTLEEARASTQRWKEGRPLSLLDGVPLIVKDLVDVKGYITTGGINIKDRKRVSAEDAPTVAALRKAGMVVVGKSNSDPLGMGVRGYNAAFGQVRNPWGTDFVPGGSSGGSGSATAAGLCPISLGTDGGGSIRIPAACCGVYGLKPTYARLSIQGMALEDDDNGDAESVTVDSLSAVTAVGPLAITAEDLVFAYYSLTAGAPHPPIASEPAFESPFYDNVPENINTDISNLRIGVYKPWTEHSSPAAQEVTAKALETFAKAGAKVVDVIVSSLEDCRIAHSISIASKTYKGFEKNGGLKPENWYSSGLDFRAKMLAASKFTDEMVTKSEVVRTAAVNKIVPDMFSTVDVIVTPALGVDTPRIPRNLATGVLDVAEDSALIRFTSFANLSGIPAATMPVAIHGPDSLPYSIHAMAPHWHEHILLKLCLFTEQHLRPKGASPKLQFHVLDDARRITNTLES